uniref:Microcyclamide/patellamide family RiPP n=1 Tax=Cyanothece sp. (strain PCC 7425 / ATCC 29141) TaxID=395961 RepID=B8HTY4_CYAP4
MDLQNLLPQQSQPIQRATAGQLPTELAELTEEALNNESAVLASSCDCSLYGGCESCSYEGDEAE